MSLKTLNYFLKTVEEMNFTRAAEKLYITQQSLSINISNLEKQYNTELFIRKPFLKLTPAGKLLAAYAEQMLALDARITSALADVSTHCVGHINLGMSRQRSNIFFPNIWKRYHELYKNVKISLHGQVTANMIDSLQHGKLDLFVGVDVPPLNNFSVKQLASERLQCLVHEKLLKEFMPETWDSFLHSCKTSGLDLLTLKDLPFIMFLPNNKLRITADQIFSRGNITPNILLETAEHDIIFKLGCIGNGVALFSPTSLYGGNSNYGNLPKDCHLLYINNRLAENTISLISRSDIEQPKYIKALQEIIIQEFASYNTAIQMIQKKH